MNPPEELAARGVYVHPYTGMAGESFAVAVDSRGRKVAELVIPPGCEAGEYTDRLWGYLDEIDPEPAVRRLSLA